MSKTKQKLTSTRILVDMIPVIRSTARGLVDGLTYTQTPAESFSDAQLEEQLKSVAILFSIGQDLCEALVSDVDDEDPLSADDEMIAARRRQQPNGAQQAALTKIREGVKELRAATDKRFGTRAPRRRPRKTPAGTN